MDSIFALKKNKFIVVRYDLDPWRTNLILGHCILFDHRHSASELWARFDQEERRYAQGKDFICIYFFYDLNLRPRIMVQGHWTPFTQRYSVDEVWTRLGQGERRYAPLDKRSRMDRRTEGRMDRLINIERPQSGAKKIRLVHRILQVLPFHIDEDVRLMWILPQHRSVFVSWTASLIQPFKRNISSLLCH